MVMAGRITDMVITATSKRSAVRFTIATQSGYVFTVLMAGKSIVDITAIISIIARAGVG